MHFSVRSEEEITRVHQLLRSLWRFPLVCIIGLTFLCEFLRLEVTIIFRAFSLLLITIIGVALMSLTMVFSVWEDVTLHYDGSFTDALDTHWKKWKMWERQTLKIGTKALICFLQRWGNVVVQLLALLLITYYTAPTKAFWAYLCLVFLGFVLQWFGETELDVAKAWCLCFATTFGLYHLVYLSNLWGMGFKGCHPITRVAFFTKRYYIKAADDDSFTRVCDESAEPMPHAIEDTSYMNIELQCPVPYPLSLIFSSSSMVHLAWTQVGLGSGTLEVDHKFSTRVFCITIPSIETDYQFRLPCCEFGCARVFMFMRGVKSENAVLMKKVEDISCCYSLRETITFVANPDNKLIRKESDEENWCCWYQVSSRILMINALADEIRKVRKQVKELQASWGVNSYLNHKYVK